MPLKFLLAFAIISAAALALPAFDADADAARLGGGKSFGSAPSMGKSIAPPLSSSPGLNRSTPGRDTPGAGATASMRPGMGGMLGGLLAGSLIGSLLFGGGFHGGGLMDILLIGFLFYLACKIFSRFRRPVPAAGSHSQLAYRERENESTPPRRSGMDWEQFRSGPTGELTDVPAAGVPADFDTEEFLRGAKLAYTRLQASWDARDLNDIADFATEAVMEEIRAQAESDPVPSTTEILLINARLLSVTEEQGRRKASVFFDVLLREDPQAQATNQAREVWHFMREASGNWKLDGIQQVEG